MRKTLVLGASTNPRRFSYKAVKNLQRKNIPVVAVGFRKGEIGPTKIETGKPLINQLHTIALYMGKLRQVYYYEYILELNPQRIIFNPGTENPELMTMADEQGIEVVTGCMLVMLHTGKF